jgi:uncharacterized membrane protein YqiK
MNSKFELNWLNHLTTKTPTQAIAVVNTETPYIAQLSSPLDLGWLMPLAIFSGGILTVLITLYLMFTKFYRVCNTNEAFVISGPTRDKQVITRSTLFFPGFETITIVSLNQVTVSVVRGNTAEKPLRTKDYLKAVFNGSLQVRVNPDQDSIRNAAMLLGTGKKGEKEILVAEEEVKKRVNDILEGHLRDAASQANLGELQGSVETVTNNLKSKVEPDLARYGLQLLNIAITNIDELNHYNPDNYLDIQAVVTRESIVQQNKKELEKVQEETKTEIALLKLLETQKQLDAERQLKQKQLENTLQTEQMTAANERQVLEVRETERATQELLKVQKQQAIEEGMILSEKQLKEQHILQQQALEEAEITKGIAINQKNQELANAEKALIESQKAVSLAATDKETAIKLAEEERQKALALIKAEQDKQSALIAQQGELEQERLRAENEKIMALQLAEAIKVKAAAELDKALKEAEGEKAKISAQNTLSIKALTVQLAEEHLEELITVLPQVMAALAPQPGVLGANPIILAGTQDGDNGDPTKLLLATSGLTLLTKLLQSPVVTHWGEKLMQGLETEAPLAESQVMNFLQNNPQLVAKLNTPKPNHHL